MILKDRHGPALRTLAAIPVVITIMALPSFAGELPVHSDALSYAQYSGMVAEKPDTATQSRQSYGDEPFVVVEEMPVFEGGDIKKFTKWVQSRIKSPKELKGKSPQVVNVRFVVDAEGNINEICILTRDESAPLPDAVTKEVMRVMGLSPKWTPGKQQGMNVRVLFTLQLIF